MQKSTLEAVGLRTNYDIPAGEIFSSSLDRSKYGLSEEQMAVIHCLKDFVKEYNREIPKDTGKQVSNSKEAAALLYPTLRGLECEEVWVAFLNNSNVPVNTELISSGGLASSIMEPRKVVRKALECNAAAVILYHNHPSGNPKPSASDVRETERLRDCLKVFDINLVDHIIVSDSSFYSFADESVCKYSL